MAVTYNWYSNFILELGQALHDLDASDGDYGCLLVSSSYTFSAAHQDLADITGEITTNGGSRIDLTTVTWAADGSYFKWDALDNPTWTATGGDLTARGMIVYKMTGSTGDSDRKLVCFIDFGQDETAGSGTDFIVELAANGLFRALGS